MIRDENILTRLLRAAKRPECETPESIPPALEARILARWRSSSAEDNRPETVGCFRIAVACAVLVMIASIGWSHFTSTRDVPGAMAFSNLAQAVQIVP